MLILILETAGGDWQVALHKRKDNGLLAGLWEFPNLTGHMDGQVLMKDLEGQGLGEITPVMELPATHTFSHIRWLNRGVYLFVKKCPEQLREVGEIVWADLSELTEQYALPSAFKPFVPMLYTLTEEKK